VVLIKAILPAAGYGTRLYPLTKDKPKALLDVSGRPMIGYVIEKIKELDAVDAIYIITNDKFYDSFLAWSEKFPSELPVKVINDGTTSNETRLGSIGDIDFLIDRENIDDDVLIINSDNIFTFSIIDMLSKFNEKKLPFISAYDVKTAEEAKKFGVPELDVKNKVIGFEEKPGNPKSTLISTGIYMFPKSTISLIKRYLNQGNSPDKTGEFVIWLCKETDVYCHIFKEGNWLDIGDLKCYEKADEIMKQH